MCQLFVQVTVRSATCNQDQCVRASEPRPGTYLLELTITPRGGGKSDPMGIIICVCVWGCFQSLRLHQP